MAAVLKTAGALPAPAPIQQLHHFAYRAKDAEETRHFYEDILGLPLYHIIQSDHVPSTGEYCPYTHFFFRLQDGSFIAFFDLGDDEAAEPSPNTPQVGEPHLLPRRFVAGAAGHEGAAGGARRRGARHHRPPHLPQHLLLRPQRRAAGAHRPAGRRVPDAAGEQDGACPPGEWTARKEQWRQDRAAGKAAAPLKPQQNDRPEFAQEVGMPLADAIQARAGCQEETRMAERYAETALHQRLRIHPGQRLRAARVPVPRAAGDRLRRSPATTRSSSSAAASPA